MKQLALHSRVGSWPHKHYNRQERLDRGKRCSLLWKGIIYGRKSIITLAPGALGLGRRAVVGAALNEEAVDELRRLGAPLEPETQAKLVAGQTVDDLWPRL